MWPCGTAWPLLELWVASYLFSGNRLLICLILRYLKFSPNTLYFRTLSSTRTPHCAIPAVSVVSRWFSAPTASFHRGTCSPKHSPYSRVPPRWLRLDGLRQWLALWAHHITLSHQIVESRLPTKVSPFLPCQSLVSATPPGGPLWGWAGKYLPWWWEERCYLFTSWCYLWV